MKNEQRLNTKEVISAFYSALALRDTSLIVKKFAQEINWYIPGEKTLAPWVGHRSKPAEVQQFFELLLSNIESVSFVLEHLLVEGDFGVATGTFVSKMLATGINYESPFSAHFQIKDGLIIYYRFLEDSNALVKALST